MKLHTHAIEWMTSLQALLWAILPSHTSASPFISSPDLVHYDVPSKNSNIIDEPPPKSKRKTNYPAVTFSSTCSPVQRQYIIDELSEIETMLNEAQTQITTMLQIIRERQQPKDWGPRFDENTRLLNTWQAYVEKIQLNRRATLGPGQAPRSPWKVAEGNMKTMYEKYYNMDQVLKAQALNVMFHCDDTFLKYQEKESNKSFRLYKDERNEATDGPRNANIPLPASLRLCHESTSISGYRYTNSVSGQEEIYICPITFEKAKTSNKLTQFANEMSTLKGKTIDEIFFNSTANTIFHELTHCEHILGNERTADQVYVKNGKSLKAYQASGIMELSYFRPDLSLKNADTLTYFALGSRGSTEEAPKMPRFCQLSGIER
ncbi:hypothetical protein P170DRAFT_430227 [Aspergillus steynii IBT 23096]|uniref:Lysine-specific metallo-endopeptidase domain-containing protein n=1 Tax=Aspergillus steynii IBT 23096 TaxID=1392250 RepID=A0A2I2FUT2_9EURO|nr:uncharacterized protein P170DRAFT_430227 [Aspergillus steynii IBT 23096]PLB44326.1 hypothetical protein P170DRAFT_430227 [Aspergillus steynii IBT 23096]